MSCEPEGRKKSEEYQQAAYDAHVRGEKALAAGDLNEAFVNDQESDALALAAMLLRMRGE